MTEVKSPEVKKPDARATVRVFRESPEKHFLSGFTRIANTRMKDVPICNPRLRVASLPFKRVDGQWVGGLVTPWSLLVVRACGNPATWERIPETQVASIKLPAGEFSFMSVRDPELGGYQSCSLLSPTWEVGDQETAAAVVRLALEAMLAPAPETGAAPGAGEDERALSAREKAPAPISRRTFFAKAAEALERKTEPPAADPARKPALKGGLS